MNYSWPQVWIHLIDQLPAIIAAAAALMAALYGVKNRNLIQEGVKTVKEVQQQGNGQHDEMVAKLDEAIKSKDDALTENRHLRGEAVINSEGRTPHDGKE